jgi:hypothetical protein
MATNPNMVEMEFDDTDEMDVRDYHEPPAEDEPQGETVSADELRELREAADVVRRFNQDPAAAIRNLAPSLGLQVVAPGQESAQGQPQRKEPPQSFIREIEDGLDEGMKFMAPMLAKSAWAAAEQRAAPLESTQQALMARARTAEIHQAIAPLAQEVPDWHTKEADMTELWNWMQDIVKNNGNMMHPRYGSIMKILYNAVNPGRATAQAVRRIGGAANARVSSPGNPGAERRNIEALIAKAPTLHDKVGIALQDAMEQLRIGR